MARHELDRGIADLQIAAAAAPELAMVGVEDDALLQRGFEHAFEVAADALGVAAEVSSST